jgi:ATP-dependent helicase/nuclease subunit A
VIASRLLGQTDIARVLRDHGMENTLPLEAATESANRLLAVIRERFDPINIYTEYPIRYTNQSGQIIGGWIDLLLETAEGFVLIDHKASPRARSDWEEIALGYSGQLVAYAEGVTLATGKPVVGRWIHFGVTGGLVELV